jgi:hypothetical protein
VFKKRGGRESYAHMVATTYAELNTFAAKIGLGGHFFHRSAKFKHYDVSTKHYHKAITAGAVVVSSKQLLEYAKVMMLTEQMKDI